MQDHEFLYQFEQCTLPKEYFKHKGHLRIAWLYLNKYSFDEAGKRVRDGIMRYAESLGALQIYHETMTQAWVRLVMAAIEEKNTETFEEFLNTHPRLTNSRLINEYYSESVLTSDTAKNKWVEPDIKPII